MTSLHISVYNSDVGACFQIPVHVITADIFPAIIKESSRMDIFSIHLDMETDTFHFRSDLAGQLGQIKKDQNCNQAPP